MRTTRTSVAMGMAAVLAIAGVCVSAQQTAPGQVPTFRTGVELVTIDVGVVDRQGQPVTDLKPGDFTVSVAGQPRRVVNVEFVDTVKARSTAALAGDSLISTNDGASLGRLFVFIVDQNTLEPGSVRHVTKSATRFFSGLSFADRSARIRCRRTSKHAPLTSSISVRGPGASRTFR